MKRNTTHDLSVPNEMITCYVLCASLVVCHNNFNESHKVMLLYDPITRDSRLNKIVHLSFSFRLKLASIALL